jgi:threonine synthase
MLYESSRGSFKNIKSVDVIKMGIAPDGGLFVPEETIELKSEVIEKMANMNYWERAAAVLEPFLSDYTREELKECIRNAYNLEKFDTKEIAPIYKLDGTAFMLELWHGPTCAFKDMALQILPHLMVKAVQKTNETKEIIILVATSGDTGKAALEGFRDVKGTRIIVFYPYKGVSQIQEMQMITQEGKNVFPIAVKGNFDDAQSGVKKILTDKELNKIMDEKGFSFSSANSINWGRLVPQIVYYFSAYADMIKNMWIESGQEVNIAVPTGNFGNILAAFYAMKMGLPVKKLICASNENNVLTDFINTGVYDKNRLFKKTMSPSMDILISSNLERLLYELTGHNSKLINQWMQKLSSHGVYEVDSDTKLKIKEIFWADYCSEEDTLATISSTYEKYGYLVFSHTLLCFISLLLKSFKLEGIGTDVFSES